MTCVPRWILLVLAAAVPTAPLAAQTQRDQFVREREEMVQEFLVREGISDPQVLKAMRTVPRHEFMLPPTRKFAYADSAYAIGHGQTISPPFIVAYMTETLEPQPDDRVLEIGTGSGYQAAVLAEIVSDVYSIEIVEPLGKEAAERLSRLGYSNVHTKVGDGYLGWAEHAPFDKIIVTCSPEKVPQPLIDQLREGGRMIIPLGRRYQQVFYLFEKRDGQLVEKKLIPTFFVPMTGQSEEEREVLPDPKHPRVINGSFETDENDDGRADSWYYQRQCRRVPTVTPVGRHLMRFQNTQPSRHAHMLQGIAIDGESIASLRISVWARPTRTARGNESYELPGLVVHFFDGTRRSIDDRIVGPWLGTSGWKRMTMTVPVPSKAREMVVRIGLNGGVGQLDVDGVEIRTQRR